VIRNTSANDPASALLWASEPGLIQGVPTLPCSPAPPSIFHHISSSPNTHGTAYSLILT
jgi:hypothetical protein